MRGLSPRDVPKRVARDVALVKKEALCVITLNRNQKIKVEHNPHFRLSVIAIIGPSDDNRFGKTFDEALLAEIGYWRGQPYHKAFGSNGDYPSIAARRKWFKITPKQYELLAPVIFKVIQELTDARVASWPNGYSTRIEHPAWVRRITVHHYRRRLRSTVAKTKFIAPPRGLTFTFSSQDEIFFPSIYWAETHSPLVKDYLSFFSRCIWGRARHQKRDFKKRLGTLKVGKQVIDLLEDSFLPWHLKVRALREIPCNEKDRLRTALMGLLGDDGSPLEQEELAKKAHRPKKSLGKLQLITKDPNKRLGKSNIRCYVYASKEVPLSSTPRQNSTYEQEVFEDIVPF